jgi:UDPglucose--hexose-1-phosphate uridylyltransferase
MNETRYDWLSDRWVIFAPNREDRPDQYRRSRNVSPNESVECPFCSGREHETPSPTLVLPELDFDGTTTNRPVDPAKQTPQSSQPWQVRVVPNKFPAILRSGNHSDNRASSHSESRTESLFNANARYDLDGELQLEPSVATATANADHLFQRNTSYGAHEVIIESPSHIDSITALPAEQIEQIFEAYRRRLNHWRAQRNLKYALIFKNYGADAGASLFHSHSQLISLDFVPRDIEKMNRRLNLHHAQYGSCYLCQMLIEEQERQERIVVSSEHFVALCPFASRFPYSFTIIPRTHRSRFEEATPSELKDLAVVTKKTLAALEAAHPSAAYNFVLQTSPFVDCIEEASHWRLRVIPRLSKVAGFEWGSDCFINTVTPEQASIDLRAHLV